MKFTLKISTLIFLMSFLFQNSYSQQNINGWYWLNGQPQSMTLNWVKYINSTTIYAVGNNGNFMKSTDGGDSWLINSQAGPIDNSATSGGGTRNLAAAHFFDANTGVVGGSSLTANGDAIGRTTDGGQTFTKIVLGAGAHSVLGFYFLNSTTGYACGNTTTRLYKTTDAGVTWTAVPNVPSNSYNSVFAFNENSIFIATSARRVVKTTDAGATWKIDTLPGTSSITFTDIKFRDANTGFITGNGNYFGYTFNGGANWTQAVSPGTSGQRALKMIGNDVYTIGDNTMMHKTTDDGTTWTSLNFVDGSNPNQPAPGSMLGFDITGSDFIVVGTSGLINISNDGAASWRNKNYCLSNTAFNFSAIWSDSPSGNIWTGGTSGTMLFSSNGGTNWVTQATNSTHPSSNIQMLNSTTGFAVGGSSSFGAGGTLIKTINAGTNWTVIPLPPPYNSRNAVDIDFLNENTGWVIGGLPLASGGGITCIKTTDGGANWTAQPNDINYNFVSVDIDMADENIGYFIAGTALHIFKTTNGGDNWIKLPSSPGSGTTYNKIVAVSKSVVFVSGGNGLLFKSTDGGITWNSIATPIATNTHFAMQWTDENNGMLGGTSGFLAKTSNGGQTWKSFNSGGSTIRNISMRNKDTVFAVSDINGSWQVFRYIEPSAGLLSLNLTVGIEGFWNGTTQVSDTIRCNLRNSVAPYNLVDQGIAVLNNYGYATVTFPTATSGNYYLQILHRNALETWSAAPVNVSSNVTSYNFTTSASQAFRNNTLLSEGKYCNYEGDVNQEGNVNLTDQLQIYNASAVFSTGYVVNDVNGNNLVDLTDIIITFNNASDFVSKVTP
ncbi:MAG: hypothetical protein IPL53_25200 [Ignavibacteria bacterium]|nr:hypothetical protein [Ignavibacteria bacterium]